MRELRGPTVLIIGQPSAVSPLSHRGAAGPSLFCTPLLRRVSRARWSAACTRPSSVRRSRGVQVVLAGGTKTERLQQFPRCPSAPLPTPYI
jgi:hypothetical protein